MSLLQSEGEEWPEGGDAAAPWAQDGWHCITVDVPGQGPTEICFPDDRWAALCGNVAPGQSVRDVARSYAAAGLSVLR